MLSQAINSSRRISEHILTLFLFTKNDILTTLIPITVFALAATPHLHVARILHTIIWIWIHLLKFDISNQIQDPEEDRRNKPHRPLPAGRITVENATDLRWVLVPICLALSAMYGNLVLASSVCFEALSMWYNDFGGHEHGYSKNVLTAGGYVCMEIGATLIAGAAPSIDSIGRHAIEFSCGVFATTLHAQDFKDEEGDLATGRRTLVTLFPTFARISMFICVPFWSICLSKVWMVDYICSAVFTAYGIFVGSRFMFYTSTSADKQSCKMYSLWFTMAHLLPGYWRLFYDSKVVIGYN